VTGDGSGCEKPSGESSAALSLTFGSANGNGKAVADDVLKAGFGEKQSLSGRKTANLHYLIVAGGYHKFRSKRVIKLFQKRPNWESSRWKAGE
jgi:hypothetical protein